MKFPKPKIISLREEIRGISSTGYLTHSLFYHPAKFIPQFVRFCLKNYCKEGGVILDPFAGSGTAGLEASLLGYDAYLMDINPLLDYFYPVKIPKFSLQEWNKIHQKAQKNLMRTLDPKKASTENEVLNENLEYWYPEHLFNYFNGVWSNFHSLYNKHKEKLDKKVIALILFKLSKKYSYAEHDMPKLFTSDKKRGFIEKLENNPSLYKKIVEEGLSELRQIDETIQKLLIFYKRNSVNNLDSRLKFFSGVDAYTFDYSQLPLFDCIITSPPYMQAQEYIRTFKMEMLWLGYSTEEIKAYKDKEIPFRTPEGKIKGNYIDNRRQNISKNKLREIFDAYFWFTIKSLERASYRLKSKGNLCILTGNPKMEGKLVEIWKVILNYFTGNLNYKFVNLYRDRITSSKLFEGRNNKNPKGMKSEFLTVLQKRPKSQNN